VVAFEFRGGVAVDQKVLDGGCRAVRIGCTRIADHRIGDVLDKGMRVGRVGELVVRFQLVGEPLAGHRRGCERVPIEVILGLFVDDLADGAHTDREGVRVVAALKRA